MTEPRPFTLALLQHACPPGAAKQTHVDTGCDMIREAARQGAQLAVTQELFASDYFPQTQDETRFELAEPIPGPTTDRLGRLARDLDIEIAASLFERRAPGLYHNTTVMLDARGQIVGRYRKMHIPDDPGFYEKYYFTPGDAPPDTAHTTHHDTDDAGWRVLPTRHARAGMLICWDQWFPEAARLTALAGAEILLYPTAIGWVRGENPQEQRQQKESWQIMQRSHAIANGVFVAAVNRIGSEGELTFWGSSFVADPTGGILAEASETDPAVLTVTCDLAQIESARRGWPFLRDRRIDAYNDLTRRLSF